MTGRTNITDEEASTTFADLAFLLSHDGGTERQKDGVYPLSEHRRLPLPVAAHFNI
jgi:hypothetical protein